MESEAGSQLRYNAPELEVITINVERGFEASSEDAGFEGPSYGEEDVEW
jgi:hypothetical protein